MEVVGEGSVIQREPGKPRGKCRTWELSVKVMEGGKPKRRTQQFHGSWKEAVAALSAFRDDLAGAAPPSGYTVGQYAERWHAAREDGGKLSPNTVKCERTRVRAICGALGHVMLEDVTADMLRDVYAAWGRKYEASTVGVMHETLSTMFADAVREGVLAKSPMGGVTRPSPKSSSRRALSPAQMESLAHALDPADGRQLGVLLCLACGLRRSEVVALRWGDWDGESVHVERADDGSGRDKEPKTRAGVRSVPAPSWLAAALDSIRGDPGEPMCQDAFGRRLKGKAWYAWWTANRGSFGVDCTLHELRHSYLTQLARAGVHPRVMMQLAGHDTMRVCMEIYTHVSDEMQKDAVRKAFG